MGAFSSLSLTPRQTQLFFGKGLDDDDELKIFKNVTLV